MTPSVQRRIVCTGVAIASACVGRVATAEQPVTFADDSTSLGLCPSSGDCCSAHGGPGCENFTCCEVICAASPNCCNIGWDGNCAALAQSLCDESVCQFQCPTSGDCCTPHSGGGCEDELCCDLVCTHQPFCCEGVWTQQCADFAAILCDDLCQPTDACPGGESCCLTSDARGCDDESCCRLICQEDPYCCAEEWDPICVAQASLLCSPLCAAPCPKEGHCCAAHEGPGCRDPQCCAAVCADTPDCCTGDWNDTCRNRAIELCDPLCGAGCPGPGSCCEEHATSGCSDAACCELVCAKNQFCCFQPWDFNCVSIAEDFCGNLCTPSCPGIGDCCNPHSGSGCADQICCERVCNEEPTCCSGDWTTACADLAATVCGLSCNCPSGFADFDANGHVDLLDVAFFQICYSGAGPTDLFLPECACGDLANNGDVDASDARAFVEQLTGP